MEPFTAAVWTLFAVVSLQPGPSRLLCHRPGPTKMAEMQSPGARVHEFFDRVHEKFVDTVPEINKRVQPSVKSRLQARPGSQYCRICRMNTICSGFATSRTLAAPMPPTPDPPKLLKCHLQAPASTNFLSVSTTSSWMRPAFSWTQSFQDHFRMRGWRQNTFTCYVEVAKVW